MSLDISKKSYTPYSGRESVAVVQSRDGSFYAGGRIENIAFPLSISAAQNALFCCLSEGKKPVRLFLTNRNDPLLRFWIREYGLSTQYVNPGKLSGFELTRIRMENITDISHTLWELLSKAQVEQSNFPVSALVKTDQGYFSGVNIECSAWNLGLCAERVAIAKALSYGSKKLIELHIKTRDGDFTSPCGACRQVIVEHMPHQQVHLYHKDNSKSVHFCGDLLPHAFRSSSLTAKKSQKQSAN